MEEHFGTECETETLGASEAENLKSVVSEHWMREGPRPGLRRSQDHPVCEQQKPSLEEGGS